MIKMPAGNAISSRMPPKDILDASLASGYPNTCSMPCRRIRKPKMMRAQLCRYGVNPDGISREEWEAMDPGYFFPEAKTFLYSRASDAEGIISIRSVSGGSSRRASLLRGVQGFVYVFGSSIVTVSSIVFWFTRWY